MSGFSIQKDIQELYKRACRGEIEFIGYVLRDSEGNTTFHMEGEARALDIMYAFSRMAADVGEVVYSMPTEDDETEEDYEDGTSH